MSYIGNTPGVSSQRVVLEEVVTGSAKSQFVPQGGYMISYVDVLVNGVELDSTDFTATDGINVNLVTAAAVGDTVKVKAWLPRGLSDGYTKAEADALFSGGGGGGDGLTVVPYDPLDDYLGSMYGGTGASADGNLNIALGVLANADVVGGTFEHGYAVAIGYRTYATGIGSISIGGWASALAADAIAIGHNAINHQGGVILNASGTLLNPSATGFYVKPVRANGNGQTSSGFVNYDQTSGEVFYNPNLKFPAVQVASADANTLDDYEEGTWTPTVVSGSPTYGSLSGTYTKVGRLVTCTVGIFSSVGGGITVNKDVTFGGLPFSNNSSVSFAMFETFNPVYAAASPNYVNMYVMTTQFRSQSSYSRAGAGGGETVNLLASFSYIV